MANPTVIEFTQNDTQAFKCTDCGRWEYAAKGAIRHSKRCDLNGQPAFVLEKQKREELYCFARSVKRTGLSGGRHADVEEAVRLGFLSQSDAMNLDD